MAKMAAKRLIQNKLKSSLESGLSSSRLDDILARAAQEDAATKIQSVHRGKTAREKRKKKHEQHEAAVKIQSAHRGKQTRMELSIRQMTMAKMAAKRLIQNKLKSSLES